MKMKEKIEARRLRVEEKLSMKTIAEILGVAKSSISLWVRDLPLSVERLEELHLKGRIKGGDSHSRKARKIRVEYQEDGIKMAERLQSNSLFFGGCMMQWAEGTKNKNRVGISNTDPDFLRLWLRFISSFFDIQKQKICLAIHCYLNNGKTLEEIENYWIKELDLPSSCLRRTSITTKHPMSKGYKKNKHPYGCAHLKIDSTKTIQQIWGAIKFLGGIKDKEKWLG